MHDGVLQRETKVRIRVKSYYSRAIDRLDLHRGDKVVVCELIVTRKDERKLLPPWSGSSPTHYRKNVLDSDIEAEVHVNCLKSWQADDHDLEAARPLVYPDVPRFLRRIEAHEDRNGGRRYKLKLRGKRPAIWCSRTQLSEAVWRAYDLTHVVGTTSAEYYRELDIVGYAH